MAGSKGGRGGKGATAYTLATSVMATNGDTLTLPLPLKYGNDDDGVTGAARANIDAWEKKRRNAKIEYAYMTDPTGKPVGEVKGGKGSVATPLWMKQRSDVFTHIHPRGKGEEGYIGGTFSQQDLQNFQRLGNMKTYRAAAAEGTYSITKGSNFDANGFSKALKAEYENPLKANTANMKALGNDLMSGKMGYTEYLQAHRDGFNGALVQMHDWLLANQKKYGYKYTLERAK